MFKKALDTVEKFNMLHYGDKVVTGVSGGADSTALLLFLCSLKEKLAIEVYAVHVHHGIRGEEADRDMNFVKELCARLNVPCRIAMRNVVAMSKRDRLSEEEAGRIARYEEFENEAKIRGASAIAVAHNLNDQAETVIMRLCRGAGITGLAGIRPVRGKIIRPLLYCSRTEIEEYLRSNNQNFIIDSTNFETEYARNRVRLSVMPYLEKEINSGAVYNIAKSANMLYEEDEFIEYMAKSELDKAVIEKRSNEIVLNSKILASLHYVLLRRVIRLALRHIKKDIKDITLTHINSICQIIKNGGHSDINGGIKADESCGVLKIYMGDGEKNKNGGYFYNLLYDEPVFLKEAEVFIEISQNATKNDKTRKYLYTKVFNCDKISGNITVRNRKNGDRIRTDKAGNKTAKLKDIFIDKKIPSFEREKIPVIECQSGIISVLGVRDSAFFLPDENTENYLYIRVWRKEND